MTVKFEGLTMNQLAERNAELVTQNEELQRKVEALESRTIEVFLPRKHQTSCSVDDVWYAPDEVHEAIRIAGGVYQECNDA